MPDEKNHYGSGVLVTGAVLLALYIFCPVVFIVPLVAAEQHHWISGSVLEKVEIVFAPIQYLGEHVALYHDIIDAEFDCCERAGLVDLSK